MSQLDDSQLPKMPPGSEKYVVFQLNNHCTLRRQKSFTKTKGRNMLVVIG